MRTWRLAGVMGVAIATVSAAAVPAADTPSATPATPATPAPPMAPMPPPVFPQPSPDPTGDIAMSDHLPTTLADWSAGAKLYDGIGTFHRRISTHSAEAQRFFDQGMRFLWTFNHDESTRSFARALELDPACAICAWGVALTVGPNYNLPELVEPRAKIAFEASTRAEKLAASSTKVEQALIAALTHRYPNAQPLDTETAAPVLTDYAAAMRAVARRFPDDLDVQTLYAESLMNLHAWKLWNADGTPAPGTPEIVATLERVLARQPMHVGALHYYVHAVEASPHPEKAVAAAERLRGLAPAAGHLVHMPSHIFQRVGRYEDAAEANRKGVAADLAYMATTMPLDYYPMYLGHNYQFLAFSAAMEGRKAETLDAVRRSRASVSDAMLKEMPGVDWYVAQLYAAYVRFGEWDALLEEKPPDPGLPGLTGGYLYATAVALASKDRPAEAWERLAQLNSLLANLPAGVPAGQNTLRDVLAVATRVAAARIAAAEERHEDAVRDLRDAVRLEDALGYDEPSDWFFPVRHLLGAELLRAGMPGDAERVYREQLKLQPHDGWALRGLALTLATEGKNAAARAADARFQEAWKQATVSISASAF
jgi:tetratricopeptide (TPR) repeat protein